MPVNESVKQAMESLGLAQPVAPTVHMNGDTRETLTAGLQSGYRAVSAAIQSLSKYPPNARDYYLHGPDAYGKARAVHEARVTALLAVRQSLEDEMEAIE